MKPLGKPPHVCLITAGHANSANYESEGSKILENVGEAISLGVDLIQLREKDLSAGELFDLVTRVVAIALGTDTLILVNDRADIAVAAGADGVHLTENSIPSQIIRDTFPRELVIGVSTHSLANAKSAALSGADYIFFGPVFETPGKGEPAGLQSLQQVCQELKDFPVIALGGIDPHNVEQIFPTGAAGVAAIRALNTPETTRELMRAMAAIDIR